VVIPGHAGALLAGQERAARAVSLGRASHVWNMRLLPFVRMVLNIARRYVCPVMHPAIPAGRNSARLGIAIVHHPAASASFGVLATLEIDVAKLVFTNARAVPPGVESRV